MVPSDDHLFTPSIGSILEFFTQRKEIQSRLLILAAFKAEPSSLFRQLPPHPSLPASQLALRVETVDTVMKWRILQLTTKPKLRRIRTRAFGALTGAMGRLVLWGNCNSISAQITMLVFYQDVI